MMPANGRWDLIRRLKVNVYCHTTAVGCWYIAEMYTILKTQHAQKKCTNSFCIHDRSPYTSCCSSCAFDDDTRLRVCLTVSMLHVAVFLLN